MPESEPVSARPRQSGAIVTTVAIVGGGILTQMLTTVNGVLAARMLGVEGRGQVVLVIALAMMASQLTLGGGLPNALTKVLTDRGVTVRDGIAHLVPSWLAISLVPSGLAAGYLLFLERTSEGNTKYWLAIALAVMAIQTMGLRILIGSMLGEGTPVLTLAVTSLAPQAAITAALALAFALGARLSAVELLTVMIGSAVLTTLVRLFTLRKPTRDPADRIASSDIWRLARATHIGNVGPIDGLALDRTLVGTLLGTVQLGLYSAAFALAGLTSIIGGSLAMIVLPRVALAQNDSARERHVVRSWLVLSAVLILGCVAVLEVIAAPVIRLAFGDAFTGATECAYWLVAAGGLLSFRRVLIAVLQGRGQGGWASWIEIALTPFVVLGIWLSSERESLVAVGITMTVAGAIGCLLLGIATHQARPRAPSTEPPVATT